MTHPEEGRLARLEGSRQPFRVTRIVQPVAKTLRDSAPRFLRVSELIDQIIRMNQ